MMQNKLVSASLIGIRHASFYFRTSGSGGVRFLVKRLVLFPLAYMHIAYIT
jgi:hypothetical protein